MLDSNTLSLLSRPEIQKLARVGVHGLQASHVFSLHVLHIAQANQIKANLKTSVIIELLVERSRQEDIKPSVA